MVDCVFGFTKPQSTSRLLGTITFNRSQENLVVLIIRATPPYDVPLLFLGLGFEKYCNPSNSSIFSNSCWRLISSVFSHISWRKLTPTDLSKMSFLRLWIFGFKLLRLYDAMIGNCWAIENLSCFFCGDNNEQFPSSWGMLLSEALLPMSLQILSLSNWESLSMIGGLSPLKSFPGNNHPTEWTCCVLGLYIDIHCYSYSYLVWCFVSAWLGI